MDQKQQRGCRKNTTAPFIVCNKYCLKSQQFTAVSVVVIRPVISGVQ